MAPELNPLVDALRKRHGGQAVRAMHHLHRMVLDYPLEVLVDAVQAALTHQLIDLPRIERMVLRRIAGEFFRLPLGDEADPPPAERGEEGDHDRRSGTTAAEPATPHDPRDPGPGAETG